MAITNPSSERLELHVFGWTQGESIVLRLPTGTWGVVDCWARSLDDPQKNPTLQFLAENGVTELEFLCLTRPHEDHYRGISQLIDRFRVRYFWYPAAMSGHRLGWLLKAAKIDSRRAGFQEYIDDANELERIFRLVEERRTQSREPLIPKNPSLGTQLYPVPVDPEARLQVWAVAPSGRSVARYESGIAKCFSEDGRFISPVPHSHHNLASMALLVLFGKTRLILGGDVEADGWHDAIVEFGAAGLRASAVKISHHGSVNGYTDDLWQHFAADGPPLGVVTAFRRHGLPQAQALTHTRKYTHQIVTPCLPAIPSGSLPIPLSTKAPVESRRAVHRAFKASTDTTDIPSGMCSFVFNDGGNVLEQHLNSPAGVVTD